MAALVQSGRHLSVDHLDAAKSTTMIKQLTSLCVTAKVSLQCRLWGHKLSWVSGQSMSALPPMSDVDLLGNGKCIIHLDAKVSNRAFDLAVAKKQLYGSQIARAPVDQRRLGSAK